MAVRATGPVEEDFREGKLREWVAHMFNRTNQAVVVELRVFDVGPGPVELLGFANRVLNPNSGGALLISKRGREVTWAQIEHSLGPDDVIVNFHGKTRDGRALAGAMFRHEETIEFPIVIGPPVVTAAEGSDQSGG